MSKHWTEYKKNETSMSFAGCHFFARTHVEHSTFEGIPVENEVTDVAVKCPCGWMLETEAGQIDEEMISAVTAHNADAHTTAAV
jgi:hypothetical protein